MVLACAPSAFHVEPIVHGRATIGVSASPGLGSAALAADLDVVAAFRPDAIVTLLPGQELRLLGRADLLESLAGVTPQHHHLPLPARGQPDTRFERLWSYTGHRLRAILRRGGRVLLQDDGSGVRTRWVAARLLSELGATPSDVAASCRAGPGLPPPLSARSRMADHHLAGRMLGCLFGGALGDAFGYPVEFKSGAEIRALRAAAPPAAPPARLVASDDTQLTLFTADGLLSGLAGEGPRSAERILARIRYAYLAWFRTQREDWAQGGVGFSQHHRELWVLRAPGSTCLSALQGGARGTPTAPINDSKGSGGVMRIAPLGLAPTIDADEAFGLAHAAAALTHGHPSGRLSAAALASLLRDLLTETPMTLALDLMESRLEGAAGGDETLTLVRQARALATQDTPPHEAIAALGEGWTGDEALAIALYAALRADSFEDAVRLAADHDGDSDTTASIAGQIWGVLYGLDVIPHEWVRRLDLLEPLCDVAQRLVANAAVGASAIRGPHLAPVAG